MSKSQVLAEPILVGREKELEELQSLLNLAIEGKGKTVFISGEAGAGKTRLLKDFLNKAREQGFTILSGWCLSNAAVPYFPFFEAFNAFFASEPKSGAKDITEWLKGPHQAKKGGKPDEISPQVWKDQTFVAVAKTLGAISNKNPVILFLDDVHWADSASLALIHYIARTIASEKILVLAAFRSEELTLDSEGRPCPLVETLRLMRREDLYVEIKLSNLSQRDVSKLACNMLGGSVQAKLSEKLADESQGNPLFIVESLRMLYERSGLVEEHDEWHLTRDEFGIPDKIKDIILQRLSCLTSGQRRVLNAASVIGERFDVELLAAVQRVEVADVIETLDAIGQITSLVCSEGEIYKFDHARSRDAVYDEISLAQRRIYHSKTAEKLESRGNEGKLPLSDLSYHFSEAGNKKKAVKYSLASGQDALARWSNVEAAKHFDYALNAISDDPKGFTEKTEALEGLGDALYASNNFTEAAKMFEQLADIQKDASKLRALRKAMFAAFYLGDKPLLVRLTRKAEENAIADRLESARVLHQRSRIQQDSWAVWKGSEEALMVFEEEYALSDSAWVLFVIGYQASFHGELERGVEAGLRAIALYDELGDVRSQMEAYLFMGLTLANCALFEDADSMFAKVINFDEHYKMGDYLHLVAAYAHWAAYLLRINGSKSISKALKALEYSKKTDSTLYLGFIYEVLVAGYSLSEDLVHADEYFEKIMSLRKTSPYTWSIFRFSMMIYFAAKNEFEKSSQNFSEGLTYLKRQGPNPSRESSLRQLYSWALSRQGKLEEAKFQLEEAEKILAAAQNRFSHVNLRVSLMTLTKPEVNQEFCLRLDIVNVSKSQGSILKVENLLVPGLKVVNASPNCIVHDYCVELREKEIVSFQVKTVELKVEVAQLGEFRLSPTVAYVDDFGQCKTNSTRSFLIAVQPTKLSYEILPGRLTTGTLELDKLLYGGVPESYATALVSHSSEERQRIIENYVEAGPKNNQVTFHFTSEFRSIRALVKKYPSNMFLFVCNPKADLMIKDSPNVYKLRGVDNLTDIEIALARATRQLSSSTAVPRRACIEIVSDVLLQHHSLATRKWLISLVQELKSKGFTTMAVVNPDISPNEVPAILNLFDGEIRVTEKETPEGTKQTLKIKKLINQKYSDKEVVLNKEKLAT